METVTNHPPIEQILSSWKEQIGDSYEEFGLRFTLNARLKSDFPNAWFHKFLLSGAKDWFSKHPLSPPPFMRW